ncbi:MAG TPA: hypothetical protein VFU47_13100, partial [Armatimonadota bacterium]|nr:hypothetical protein [Armatimonadota bacterium]
AAALLGLALFSLPAGAQVIGGPIGGGGIQQPNETTAPRKYQIPRRTVSGVVKSVDKEKMTVTVATGKGKSEKLVPVDASAGVYKAGKGSATFQDIHEGDKIKVYGEATVQGGLRAMEITLPKERMSIAPVKPEKPAKSEKAAKSDKGEKGKQKESASEKPKEGGQPAGTEADKPK